MQKYCSVKNGQLLLRVYLQPGAKADEIAGIHDNMLKIKVKAPAVEGKANTALIKFLAKQLNVPIKNISLIKGEKSRQKQLTINNFKKIPSWIYDITD